MQKVLDHLEKLGYSGIDVSIEESLLVYGLVGKQSEKDEYHFIYRVPARTEEEVNELYFDHGWLTTQDIQEKLELGGESGLLSFVGMNKKEWLKTDPINQVCDLLSYWGYLEIFGDCYYPLKLDVFLKWEK